MKRKNIAGKELIRSLREAADIAEGKAAPAAIHHVPGCWPMWMFAQYGQPLDSVELNLRALLCS